MNTNPLHTPSRLFWIMIGLACIAYTMPWVHHANHTLDLNAYDLAEWLALHPATWTARIPSLLLRGQLLILVALITWRPYAGNRGGRWLIATMAGVLIVAQLPPLDFVSNTNDLNQRQQFALAFSSTLITIAGLSHLFMQYRTHIVMLLGVFGIGSIGVALWQALMLMPAYGLATQLGLGGGLMLLSYFGIVVQSYTADRQNAKEPLASDP